MSEDDSTNSDDDKETPAAKAERTKYAPYQSPSKMSYSDNNNAGEDGKSTERNE